VDAADYVVWRKGGPLQNEVDNPGTTNAQDYTAASTVRQQRWQWYWAREFCRS